MPRVVAATFPVMVHALASSRPPSSGGIQVILPEIDVDAVSRRHGVAPEVPRCESHRVDWGWMVTPPVRLRVGKIVYAVHAMDDPFLATRIPGQAGVPLDVLVSRHHPVARPEPGGDGLPRPLRQTLYLRENRG